MYTQAMHDLAIDLGWMLAKSVGLERIVQGMVLSS